MRQERILTMLMATMSLAVLNTVHAQVQNLGTGQYRLTPLAPTPSSFSIGTAYTAGYALDFHGDQMTPPLGNVFKTDAGSYSYEWNTAQLAPGTYFCALLVDGNVVVKRAVKVAH